MAGFIPYCGSPPAPGALHWNFDLLLVSALLLLTAAHMQFARSRGVVKRDMGVGCLGWLLLSLVHLSALQSERGAVLGSRHATHDDRSDCRADDCERIYFAPGRGAMARLDRLGRHLRLRRNLLDLA